MRRPDTTPVGFARLGSSSGRSDDHEGQDIVLPETLKGGEADDLGTVTPVQGKRLLTPEQKRRREAWARTLGGAIADAGSSQRREATRFDLSHQVFARYCEPEALRAFLAADIDLLSPEVQLRLADRLRARAEAQCVDRLSAVESHLPMMVAELGDVARLLAAGPVRDEAKRRALDHELWELEERVRLARLANGQQAGGGK